MIIEGGTVLQTSRKRELKVPPSPPSKTFGILAGAETYSASLGRSASPCSAWDAHPEIFEGELFEKSSPSNSPSKTLNNFWWGGIFYLSLGGPAPPCVACGAHPEFFEVELLERSSPQTPFKNFEQFLVGRSFLFSSRWASAAHPDFF